MSIRTHIDEVREKGYWRLEWLGCPKCGPHVPTKYVYDDQGQLILYEKGFEHCPDNYLHMWTRCTKCGLKFINGTREKKVFVPYPIPEPEQPLDFNIGW